MFKVKINDGFCEWEYPLEISAEYSINQIYTELCKTLNARKQHGKRISSVVDGLPDIDPTRGME